MVLSLRFSQVKKHDWQLDGVHTALGWVRDLLNLPEAVVFS
jgi:hypothetical protein